MPIALKPISTDPMGLHYTLLVEIWYCSSRTLNLTVDVLCVLHARMYVFFMFNILGSLQKNLIIHTKFSYYAHNFGILLNNNNIY